MCLCQCHCMDLYWSLIRDQGPTENRTSLVASYTMPGIQWTYSILGPTQGPFIQHGNRLLHTLSYRHASGNRKQVSISAVQCTKGKIFMFLKHLGTWVQIRLLVFIRSTMLTWHSINTRSLIPGPDQLPAVCGTFACHRPVVILLSYSQWAKQSSVWNCPAVPRTQVWLVKASGFYLWQYMY